MHEKRSLIFVTTLQVLLIFAITEQSVSDALKILNDTNYIGSSIIFKVQGNVYPKGAYFATLYIGQPAKPYDLEIDTGSDLTWLQCAAPCDKCFPSPHHLYNPMYDRYVKCAHPWCIMLHLTSPMRCHNQRQCDYKVQYADHGSTLGVLLRKSYTFELNNGTFIAPTLPLGCGYDQEVERAPYVDGVLGLGKGLIGIINQLSTIGVTRNVLGHCLGTQGGGYFFIGDDFVPSSGIVWTATSSENSHYTLGPANLQFDEQDTGIQGISVLFNSGSTYTYFNPGIYEALFDLIKKNINASQLQDATDDGTLPVCWKGAKPFTSILDVKNLFKTLALSFTDSTNQFFLPPEAYLIISVDGNVCLGILQSGGAFGQELENTNIIGDISFQDKLVIFDNEKEQIGWTFANCTTQPKS